MDVWTVKWMMLMKFTIIGITGMSGVKKSKVAEILSSYGMRNFSLSSVLKEELAIKGVKQTPENIARAASKMRKKYGASAVAKKLIGKIKLNENDILVIDGIRNVEEVNYLKRLCSSFTLLCIHSSPLTRLKMAMNTKSNLKTLKELEKQDEYNLNLGIGEVIAKADYMIINEDYIGISLEEQVHKFINFLESKKIKVPKK
jgi:dephospho-CoA kinase